MPAHEPSFRSVHARAEPRRVTVVTGTRAEFGLLLPVIRAIEARDDLALRLLAGGSHLLPPARTIDEVRAVVRVDDTFEMQRPGETGRLADAAALGRGTSAIAADLALHPADVVLVLGDRIEAFAAASAASIAGIRVAHVHGGDRAEGVADEAMRHAITKLAHVHLPATARSAMRILGLGEEPRQVHLVGSPALDGLFDADPEAARAAARDPGRVPTVAPADDEAFAAVGTPASIMLLHPVGDAPSIERVRAEILLEALRRQGPVLALHPNFDPGRTGIVDALHDAAAADDVVVLEHLPRERFLALLRRVGLLAGNSSAALIEAAALRVRAVNVGPRQGGREHPPSVIDCPSWDPELVARALDRARVEPIPPFRPVWGDGRAGPRIAEVLATYESEKHPLAKRNTF